MTPSDREKNVAAYVGGVAEELRRISKAQGWSKLAAALQDVVKETHDLAPAQPGDSRRKPGRA